MNKNIVIFKGVQNGILVILDNNVSFNDIEKTLLKKVKKAKSFFEDANISITFKGRDLSQEEEAILLNIIAKESGVDISFVNNSLPNKIIEGHLPILIQKINKPQNNITHFHKGSLRNGQKINFAGSIVIIGDVNPGGQIIAEGNVIVLGKLKGFVHAGCKGDKNSFIAALYMMPSQLIIGDCLAYFSNDKKRYILPEYAYVKDNKIFVDKLIKR